MKVYWLWVLVLVLVVGAAFMILAASSSAHDMAFPDTGNGMTATTSIKDLKDGSYTVRSSNRKIHTDNMNLEDYHQIDPAPSSTATITSGPIEHNTPLMPYVPKPTPPYHPKHIGSPLPPSPA